MVLYEFYISHKLLQIVLLVWICGLYDKRDKEGGSCNWRCYSRV